MTTETQGTTTHDLKCWPAPFAAVLSGEKAYEIRVNDRDYRVGDVLRLREWRPPVFCESSHCKRNGCMGENMCPRRSGGYTGRECMRVVTYMTPGGEWGLPNTLCVLSLAERAP